jgi:hypothetical protein
MQKIVFSATAALFCWMIFVESGVATSLMLFLLSGTIPGTSFTISPNVMLFAIGAIAWLVLLRMTALSTLNFIAMKKLIAKHIARRERLPKRRFNEL